MSSITVQERAIVKHENGRDVTSLISEIRESFRLDLRSSNDKVVANAKKILNHFDENKEKVQTSLKRYFDWGLSFLNKDFYILVRGNEVQMPLDYKAFARLAVQNARLAGYDLILEAGVIREGFKKGYILKDDSGDEKLVIANPMVGKIVSPWAKYKLISAKTHDVISSIVEVIPPDEYLKAMQAGGYKGGVGTIHKNYATEGAKKIAMRRVIKHISYMFPNMQDLELMDNEQYNHNTQPQEPQIEPQLDPLAEVPKGLSKYES